MLRHTEKKKSDFCMYIYIYICVCVYINSNELFRRRVLLGLEH